MTMFGTRGPSEVDEDDFVETILGRLRPRPALARCRRETAQDIENAVAAGTRAALLAVGFRF